MEKDCVSLEMAKELERVGWKGEGHWSYLPKIGYVDESLVEGDEDSEDDEREIPVYERTVLSSLEGDYTLSCDFAEEMRPGIIPAPTTAELAEWLPGLGPKGKSNLTIVKRGKNKKGYRVGYFNLSYFESVTLPDALAKMAVYLLDNKIV